MSTVGTSSGTAQQSPAGFDLCLIWGDTATQVDRTESFLIARGYAARLDQASGVTSVLLTDPAFRPLCWDVGLAAEFAGELGGPVRLVGGNTQQSGEDAQGATPAADGIHIAALVQPDGSLRELGSEELRATIADIPDRVSGDDKWLVVGQLPGGPSPQALTGLASAALPAEAGLQAHTWFDQGWFVSAITCGDGADPGAQPVPEADCQSLRPAAAAALATAARGGRKRPVLVIRHSSVDTVVMQPGARDWAEFPLEWGLRRTWVHPRWGVAVVDQDRAVSQFAKAWDHAGGAADEVNLRALSRRRAMKGEVLSPLLASLSVPPAVADLVLTLALSQADQPKPTASQPDPQVLVGDPERGARRWGSGGSGFRRRRFAWGASSRAVHAVGAVAGLAVGLRIIAQGVQGWDWAGLAVIGLVSLTGSANLVVSPIRARLHRSGGGQARDGQVGAAGVPALPGEAEPR